MRVQIRRAMMIRGVPRGCGIMKSAASRTWNICRVMRCIAERFRSRDVRVTGVCVIIIINARICTGGRQMWKLRIVIRIE